MAVKYTEEQLNSVDKSFLIQLLLQQQEQLEAITKELHASNEKMQLLMEQVILGKQNRFGRSSEKMEDTSQICFQEVDGTIVFFNEAEAVYDLNEKEPDELELKSPKQPKRKGKKESDLSGLTVRRIDHYLSEEELEIEFGVNGWKQLPDAISKKYHFVPARVEVEEHHIGVYASKTGQSRPSKSITAWKFGITISWSCDHQWKVCECSSSLSVRAGIPALWPADHKAEHGKLVHTFGRGISIDPL